MKKLPSMHVVLLNSNGACRLINVYEKTNIYIYTHTHTHIYIYIHTHTNI